MSGAIVSPTTASAAAPTSARLEPRTARLNIATKAAPSRHGGDDRQRHRKQGDGERALAPPPERQNRNRTESDVDRGSDRVVVVPRVHERGDPGRNREDEQNGVDEPVAGRAPYAGRPQEVARQQRALPPGHARLLGLRRHSRYRVRPTFRASPPTKVASQGDCGRGRHGRAADAVEGGRGQTRRMIEAHELTHRSADWTVVGDVSFRSEPGTVTGPGPQRGGQDHDHADARSCGCSLGSPARTPERPRLSAAHAAISQTRAEDVRARSPPARAAAAHAAARVGIVVAALSSSSSWCRRVVGDSVPRPSRRSRSPRWTRWLRLGIVIGIIAILVLGELGDEQDPDEPDRDG